MALICLDANTAKGHQAPLNVLGVPAGTVDRGTGAAAFVWQLVSEPLFVSALLRVSAGLAAGLWLVEMVKTHVG